MLINKKETVFILTMCVLVGGGIKIVCIVTDPGSRRPGTEPQQRGKICMEKGKVGKGDKCQKNI